MVNGRLHWALVAMLVAAGTVRSAPTPPAQPTVWNFDDPAQPFAATGPARLGYRDPDGTGWGARSTTFAKASALGLPLIDGKDTGVMAFPATTPAQGYTLTHGSAPNGVFAADGHVSNYTLVMDLFWPKGRASRHRSLFQTHERNSDDGDMFVKQVAPGKLGVGVDSFYNAYGAVAPGSWHRVAIAMQCALGPGGTGQMHKYIDGRFVGGYDTPEQTAGDTRCRWALGPELHLFADDDGETAAGYVASILYVDRFMLPDEIRALGHPNAAGANVPGRAAPAVAPAAKRRVLVFAHRGQTGRMPENTLAALRQAFTLGADHAEVDIRRTADGQLVLMHDPTVDRTTTGTGPVASLRLRKLKALDAGSWLDPAYAGERVPTLVEALAAARGKGRLLLDVKEMGLGEAIQQALEEAGTSADAIWPSLGTSREAAADFTKHIPGVGILWGAPPDELTPAGFADLRRLGVVGFDLHHSFVTPAFVKAAHESGMFVVAYTILDPDTMLKLIALGVDGMETDFPEVLDQLMPPRKPPAPREAFWSALAALCGKAFRGRLVEGTAPSDAVFRESELVMHVRECGADTIRIPFHVGADRSRTWVLTRTAGGLRLKHDHRHEDGSEDRITRYGGDTRDAGSPQRQEFPADAHTAALTATARTNVWTVEVVPGRSFAYALRREGTDRRVRVEFDLAHPVPAPPPPWGSR